MESAKGAVAIDQDLFCLTERHRAIARRATELAQRFAERAPAHDRAGTFPMENIADLHRSGHSNLTIPREYGGEGGGVYEMVLAQSYLARGDASTALAIGWHLFKLGQLAETRPWDEAVYARVCREAVEQGHLINAAVSEPETGSPSRGGRPTTTAREATARAEGTGGNAGTGDAGRAGGARGTGAAGGWVLNGRKNFTSMAPALHYFQVSAAIEGSEANGWFLIERGTPGLRIDETWDTIGMRGTGSHDLVLEEVAVPADSLVQRFGKGVPAEGPPGGGSGWNLHIPAVYLGIAEAARTFALNFAVRHRPNSLSTAISELPHIQAQIGQMELGLLPARTLLFTLARRWDEEPGQRPALMAQVAGAKPFVVNTALETVDRAMRIVGAQSLFRSLPLERYYRDVRAGLHNPPMEDAAIMQMARAALRQVAIEADSP
ncbi:MAG: acyl-CoA dehydrogenase, short-chain specific [Firmicutes bacterium]|nr:acyl-CoA dehydrogenase, short-chain specific [Bacillota bacterium]